MNNRIFFLMVCILSLPACEGTKRSLGLERKSPDAFSVAEQDALTIPPNFKLRPPLDTTPEAPLAETVPAISADPASPTEIALLQKAGYTTALDGTVSSAQTPRIKREKEMTDTGMLRNLVDTIEEKNINTGKKDPDQLDPEAEDKRLRTLGRIS